MAIVPEQVHIGMLPDEAVLDSLADFVCGDDAKRYPVYRSSHYLTKFFEDVKIEARHDGSTRKWWVLEVLKSLPPQDVERVILRLVDLRTYKGDRDQHRLAVRSMNDILAMESLAIGFSGSAPFVRRGKTITFDDEEFEEKPQPAQGEDEFLRRSFPEEVDMADLGLDPSVTQVLQSRVLEVKSCPKGGAPLAIIFLLGSVLEGMFLSFASASPRAFNSCPAAPKDKEGAVKKFPEWTLANFIDVAHSLGLIGVDVKKFSHALRDFRNYIHPYQQMASGFAPDAHTADISWQVFRAAFQQCKRNRGRLS